MKIVKKTGLVPVTDAKNGSVYGVPPARARELVRLELATFFPIPEDVETIEVADAVEPKAPAVVEAPEAVEIPEDWENLHHLQKVKLAKSILGDAFVVPEGEKPAEIAEKAIAEELQRRAAAVLPAAE